MPWSDGWWKRGQLFHTKAYCACLSETCKPSFSTGCQQGTWDLSSCTTLDRGSVNYQHLIVFKESDPDLGGLSLAGCDWALSTAPSFALLPGAAACAVVQVVLPLPKLLITNKIALKRDGMKPSHKESFYSCFPLSLLWQVLEFLQTVSGLQPGTLFPNLFSALFLSVMFCFHGNSPA